MSSQPVLVPFTCIRFSTALDLFHISGVFIDFGEVGSVTLLPLVLDTSKVIQSRIDSAEYSLSVTDPTFSCLSVFPFLAVLMLTFLVVLPDISQPKSFGTLVAFDYSLALPLQLHLSSGLLLFEVEVDAQQ